MGESEGRSNAPLLYAATMQTTVCPKTLRPLCAKNKWTPILGGIKVRGNSIPFTNLSQVDENIRRNIPFTYLSLVGDRGPTVIRQSTSALLPRFSKH